MGDSDTEPIPVGVAEYALTTTERPLRTSGVGSCGVVAVHDERAGVSGLLHFMLPRAALASGTGPDAKFADAGIRAMLEELEAVGGTVSRSWAKLAGGARMVDFDSLDRPVGAQNVEAAMATLEDRRVPVRATDVGGDAGRTVTFDPATGELLVRTADGERRRC